MKNNVTAQTISQTNQILAEHQQLYETLRHSEERYRKLFENSPISLWEEDLSAVKQHLDNLRESGITDFSAYFDDHPEEVLHCVQMVRILDVNEATIKLYKAKNKQMLLTNLENVFTEEAYPLFREELIAIAEGKATEGDAIFECEAINRTLEGDILHITLRWSVPPSKEGSFSSVIISIQDVTSLRQTAQEMQRHSERRRILHEIDRAILEVQDPRETSQAALHRLQQLIPAWTLGVLLFNPKSRTLTLLSAVITDETDAYASYLTPGLTFPTLSSNFITKLERGELFMVEDIQTLTAVPEIAGPFYGKTGRALANIPLIYRQELIGTLSFIADSATGFEQEHLEIAYEVADSLAIAIHNAQLLENERTARIQTETLREITGILSMSHDEKQVPNLILEQLARVVNFKSAAVLMLGDDRYDILAYHGDSPELLASLTREIGRLPLIQEIHETRSPIIVPDTHTDPRWVYHADYEHIHSWLGVPLISKNDVIGFLTLDDEAFDYYSQRDAELTMAFANQAALAIENARLFNRTQRHAQELEQRVTERTQELSALYEVTAVANKYLDLPTILKHALDSALRAIRCQAGAIQILDEINDAPQLAAHVGLSPGLMDYMTSQDSICQTIEKETPIVIPNLVVTPDTERTYNHLSIPMIVQGKTVGVLCLFADSQQQFTNEEVALMSSIAGHVAVAVENAQLRQQAKQVAVLEERERLARDLHDSVTQSLYSLTLFTEAAHDRAFAGKLEDVQQYTVEINNTAQQTLREMRLLLYELRTTTLAEAGLVAALRRRLDAVEERAGVKTRLLADTLLELPAQIEETFFRIAQEALNNALKHGGITAVTVYIQRKGSHLTMIIEDNGKGFDPVAAQAQGGMGLDIMQERAEKSGCHLTIQSTLGQGSKIEVTTEIYEREMT